MGEKNIISKWCLDGSTRKVELCGLISKSYADSYISTMVEAALKRRVYYNGDGLTEYSDGTKVSYLDAKFVKFTIDKKTKDNEPIVGWFSRRNLMNEKFDCLHWGKEEDFTRSIMESRWFTIGSMYFDTFEDGYNFLERLASLTPIEKEKDSTIRRDCLGKSLAETLNQILLEWKKGNGGLTFSSDEAVVYFNSNIQNERAQDIYIYGNVDKANGNIRIHNPQITLTPEDLSWFRKKKLSFRIN